MHVQKKDEMKETNDVLYVGENAEKMAKYTWMKTFSLIAAWVAMGMSNSLLSATLPDLRQTVGITVEEMGRALTVGGFGGVIGALLGSISDRYNSKSDLFMSIFIMISALVVALRPWSSNLWLLSLNLFIESTSEGVINAVGNPLLLNLWKEHSGAPMQALHFGYPLGAILGPLLAYPFVSKEVVNITSNITTVDMDINTTDEAPYINTSQIYIPHIVVACFELFVGIAFLTHQFTNKLIQRKRELNRPSNIPWKSVFLPSTWADGDGKFGLTVILLLMLFYFVNVATILGSALYYTSYAIESELQFSKQEGTLYTSAINLAGGLGRASGIIANLYIPIQYFFPIIVFGQAFGAIINVLWGLHSKVGYLVTTCIYSYLSFPVWPSGYAWADRYIHLFAVGTGLIVIISKFSGTIFSYLLAYLYEYTVKESIFYNTVTAGCSLCVITVIMSFIANRHGSKYMPASSKMLPVENVESI